jgi:hypothetical protein
MPQEAAVERVVHATEWCILVLATTLFRTDENRGEWIKWTEAKNFIDPAARQFAPVGTKELSAKALATRYSALKQSPPSLLRAQEGCNILLVDSNFTEFFTDYVQTNANQYRQMFPGFCATTGVQARLTEELLAIQLNKESTKVETKPQMNLVQKVDAQVGRCTLVLVGEVLCANTRTPPCMLPDTPHPSRTTLPMRNAGLHYVR